MQTRVRKSLSLPLPPKCRDVCPRSGISSQINSHTQRNRDSSRIASSMGAKRVSGIVSNTVLLILM